MSLRLGVDLAPCNASDVALHVSQDARQATLSQLLLASINLSVTGRVLPQAVENQEQ